MVPNRNFRSIVPVQDKVLVSWSMLRSDKIRQLNKVITPNTPLVYSLSRNSKMLGPCEHVRGGATIDRRRETPGVFIILLTNLPGNRRPYLYGTWIEVVELYDLSRGNIGEQRNSRHQWSGFFVTKCVVSSDKLYISSNRNAGWTPLPIILRRILG